MEDYLDYLKRNGLVPWSAEDEKAKFARNYAKDHADWEDWKEFFETRPAETLANLILTLCHQTRYLLDKMIERQETDFKKFGGVRERMHAARAAARADNWSNVVYGRLDSATSDSELAAFAAEIKHDVDRAVYSIKRRKGWLAAR